MKLSVYAKFSLVLVSLVAVLGALVISVVFYSTDQYQQEINQKINRDLASHIVQEKPLIRDQLVDQDALKNVFHMMMVINPSIELYLLDRHGNIRAFSADPGKIKRTQVNLEPLLTSMRDTTKFPIYGDDPRNTEGSKVFSVAAIGNATNPEGYLYIILGGQDYDSLVQMMNHSHILKLSVWTIVATVLLSIFAGLAVFSLLTGKIERLAQTMKDFKSDEPMMISTLSNGDEIDHLTASFKTMANQITAQLEKLKKTDSLRRELIANVSHDLRTPLATLQAYIETLQLKEAQLNADERREYLNMAILHCHRLNRLVTELFELARLEADDTQINCESFSVSELIQDTVQKFQLKTQEKRIQLKACCSNNMPFVYADIGLVERVLENLIENAIRYTPDNGVIEIGASKGIRGIRIDVRDTGCGIPEEELPYIFERFYQLDKSRNSNPGSSGLGLAIVKRILDLHNSAIHVESKQAKGTSFRFELPIQA